MARPKLSPEEREERRRARVRHSFSPAAYEHYDPTREGYGSAEQWIAAAEALAAGRGGFRHTLTGHNPDLDTLHLRDMPADIDGLKKAFRNTLHLVHPDHGGTDEATRDALAAFARLSRHY